MLVSLTFHDLAFIGGTDHDCDFRGNDDATINGVAPWVSLPFSLWTDVLPICFYFQINTYKHILEKIYFSKLIISTLFPFLPFVTKYYNRYPVFKFVHPKNNKYDMGPTQFNWLQCKGHRNYSGRLYETSNKYEIIYEQYTETISHSVQPSGLISITEFDTYVNFLCKWQVLYCFTRIKYMYVL